MHVRHNARGFTLVEMMLVVAIIGILASVAVPQFLQYQARSRRSEALANLGGISKAQKAYYGEFSTFVRALPSPGVGPLSIAKRQWLGNADAGFQQLGYAPEGAVMYDYEVNVAGAACATCPNGDCFTATAYGDVDGNGSVGILMFVHPNELGQDCPDSIFNKPVDLDPVTLQPLYDVPFVHTALDLDRF